MLNRLFVALVTCLLAQSTVISSAIPSISSSPDNDIEDNNGEYYYPSKQQIVEGVRSGDVPYSPHVRNNRQSSYMDSAFIPYIHPRFIMEREIPEELLSAVDKRATKGMLVDVVDFVSRGAANRNRGLGQDMRSNGRK